MLEFWDLYHVWTIVIKKLAILERRCRFPFITSLLLLVTQYNNFVALSFLPNLRMKKFRGNARA